ncbi:MAG TPA: helix-turn-helix transcriptional regulator [Saprospiraceae bacterium]|nr:helix-turn-helix transcriptional regulator [Saprospiraceae bacterium]
MYHADMIGLRIRSLREAKGYSQEYMADCLGVSQSNYACLESGKTSMRVDRLMEILAVLDADINTIFSFTPTATSKENTDADKYASYPDLKLIYDQLFEEMRDEITFLRRLVLQQHG